MEKQTVFISHIAEEKEITKELKEFLENKFLVTVNVFASSHEESIDLDGDWLNTIKKSMKECQLIVIICIPISITSPWINFEVGGKAGVVFKITFLSNSDNATVAIRKTLLENCNSHTVLDLPGGTFTGAGVKTVVLFFEKGKPTQKVWYYQLNLERNLGKTNPFNENDLTEFVTLQKIFANSENSWIINIKDIDQSTYDLSVKNPNKKEEATLRQQYEILEEMEILDEESAEILKAIKDLI